MHERNIYTHSINEKTGNQFNKSWTVYKSYRIITYVILMVMFLGSLLVLVPDIANAEEVYGKISCNNCSSRILLIFKRDGRVIERTRADDKAYSVFLSPGKYKVEVISGGKRGYVDIRSDPERKHYDISVNVQ